jgi:hypothetical protein
LHFLIKSFIGNLDRKLDDIMEHPWEDDRTRKNQDILLNGKDELKSSTMMENGEEKINQSMNTPTRAKLLLRRELLS